MTDENTCRTRIGVDAEAAKQANVAKRTIGADVSNLRAQFRRILAALVRDTLDPDDPDFEELFTSQREEITHYLTTNDFTDPTDPSEPMTT